MVQIDKGGIEVPIGFKYSYSQHGDRIITLFHNDPNTLKAAFPALPTTGWKSNGYVKELATSTIIKSLSATPFPDLSDEDTRVQKLTKTLDMEWANTTPRFLLAVWTTSKVNPTAYPVDWLFRGMHSLISASGLPWRQYETFNTLTRNIARAMGEGSRVGVSVIDVGFGYPRENDPDPNKNDVISIEGTATQEFVCVQSDPQPVIIYVGTTSSGTQTPAVTPEAAITANSTTTPYATYDNVTFTVNCTKLTANTDFFLSWVKDGVVISTNTLKSDASGNYTTTIAASTFAGAPYNGSGSFKVRVTQGSLSSDSNAIALLHPAISISPSTLPINDSTTFTLNVTGYRPNESFNLSWQKNGVAVSGSSSSRIFSTTTGTYTFYLSPTIFQNSPYNGTGTYRPMLNKLIQNVAGLNTIEITAAVTGNPGTLS